MSMKSAPRAYLKVDLPDARDAARDEDDLLVLDVDALDRADPLREDEGLGREKGSVV